MSSNRPSVSRTRRRVALVVATTAALSVTASPAFATTLTGTREPAAMSIGEALLIFAGIPLAVAAVIWLLVFAPSWTRGARSTDAWVGAPLEVGSTPADAPAALGTGADAETDGTGGTSATW